MHYLLVLPLERLPDRPELLLPELLCPEELLCDELLCANPAVAQPRARSRLNVMNDLTLQKCTPGLNVLSLFVGLAKGTRRESLSA
jgi:hypothetical protein